MQLLAMILSLCTSAALTGTDSFIAGDSAQRSGAFENAAQLFSQCAQESDILCPYALSRAAQNHWLAGNMATAETLFMQVLRDYPEGPWVRMTYARFGYLYLKAGNAEKAYPYFNRVLEGLEPRPWFMNALVLARARTALALPAHAREGYNFFRDTVMNVVSNADRVEGARVLLGSSDREDRLWGCYGLIRAGNLKEGRAALQKEAVSFRDTDGSILSMADMDARVEALQQHAETMPNVDACIRQNIGEMAMRAWLMLVLREQAVQDQSAMAETLINMMIAYFNEGRDAGDACWWMGERYAKKPDIPAADRMYRLLIEKCSTHVRAPRSKLYLANHAREQNLLPEAMALYQNLAESDPKGQFAAESFYRCAQIAEARHDSDGNHRFLGLAADVGCGHFFAHRALYLLNRQKSPALESSGRMMALSVHDLVAPFPFQEDHKKNLMPMIVHFPAYPRLRFFGQFGFEEGEWESLGCILDSAKSLEKLWYPAIAEAGYMHTLMQYVWAHGWGVKDGKPTLLRQRLEYPLAYWEAVKTTGTAMGIDPFFLLAMARQESTFRAGIASGAGATGVLQMMPDTAKWLVTVDNRVTAEHASNLNSPYASIHMGGVYLSRMLERTGNNPVYALASYNAGPGNCDKWRKKFSGLSLEKFMDAIPFPETNEYVKKVLANYAAYHSLYPPPEQALVYGVE
ncbi:MAG: Soluble lytic murein transglycosylase precursor [Candidatus Hydrogenedentes bacterium ADurb.Bin179]|nr:MAG: Soluble lytic murein transglycosylase precursor [Candidatus Hydrogenedentes bacterium ADurb.Bin179]